MINIKDKTILQTTKIFDYIDGKIKQKKFDETLSLKLCIKLKKNKKNRKYIQLIKYAYCNLKHSFLTSKCIDLCVLINPDLKQLKYKYIKYISSLLNINGYIILPYEYVIKNGLKHPKKSPFYLYYKYLKWYHFMNMFNADSLLKFLDHYDQCWIKTYHVELIDGERVNIHINIGKVSMSKDKLLANLYDAIDFLMNWLNQCFEKILYVRMQLKFTTSKTLNIKYYVFLNEKGTINVHND